MSTHNMFLWRYKKNLYLNIHSYLDICSCWWEGGVFFLLFPILSVWVGMFLWRNKKNMSLIHSYLDICSGLASAKLRGWGLFLIFPILSVFLLFSRRWLNMADL